MRPRACLIISFTGAPTQRMHATVDVGAIHGVVVADRVDDALWLLSRRGAVEVSERLAVHALLKRREPPPYAGPVYLSCAHATPQAAG